MTQAATLATQNAKKPLPDGWRWMRLGEVIVDAQPGFACGERDPNGVVQLRMNNVSTRGALVWDEFIRVPANDDLIRRFRLVEGDVVFNNTNSTELVGKTALFSGHQEAVVYSNHFTRLRVAPEQANPRYIAAWLLLQWQSKVFVNLCNRWIGQSAVKNDKLLSLEVPLPPLKEQQRIATILGDQVAVVERARVATAAQWQAANVLHAAYLRAIFNSPEARQWPRTRLGEVIRQRQEVVHPHDKPSGRATFVGLEHIEPATGRRIGSLDLEMSELTGRKPRFYKGDIVYGYLRPYLNKLWVAEFDGLCSVDQYVYRVDPKKADTSFIASFMRSPVYLERAPVDVTPGYLPRIRTEEVADVELGLPPLPEQRRIAAKLSERMASADRLRQMLAEQIDTINALPAALLRLAFNGGL